MADAFDFDALDALDPSIPDAVSEGDSSAGAEAVPLGADTPVQEEAIASAADVPPEAEAERDALAEICRAAGVPQLQLQDPEQVAALLHRLQELEQRSVEELREECLWRGCAVADSGAPRAQLEEAIREALLRGQLPTPELQKLCRVRGMDPEGLQRPELLRLLARGTWPTLDFAVERLPKEVVRNMQRQALNWECLPLDELREECNRRGVPVEVLQHSDASEEASTLVQRLATALWNGFWEEKGIPLKRLSSPKVAEEVLKEVERLEAKSTRALQDEYRKLVGTLHPSLGREEVLSVVKSVKIWSSFSVPELRKECSRLGVRGAGGSAQWHGMVNRLLQELCLRQWEACGVPARALGSFDAVREHVAYHEHLEGLGPPELRQRYEELGLPRAKGTEIGTIRKRLKLAWTWFALPWEELQKEATALGVATAKTDDEPRSKAATVELKQGLVEQMLIKECFTPGELQGIPVERLRSIQAVHQVVDELKPYTKMGLAELRSACENFGLPAEKDRERPQLLERLRTVVIWRWLPLEQLQAECTARGLPAEENSKSADELAKKNDLLQRLLGHLAGASSNVADMPVERLGGVGAAALSQEYARLDGLSFTELRAEHMEWGLPKADKMGKAELLSGLKDAYLLWHLPRDELVEECKSRGVATTSLRRSMDNEAQREHLIDLLLFKANADKYEAQGIPARQLGTWKACSSLALELTHLDGSSIADLVKRYEDSLGLPGKGLGREELTKRIWQVAMWLQLPLAAVQKECRAKGVNSIAKEEERGQLVVGLAYAHWYVSPEPEPPPPPPRGNARSGAAPDFGWPFATVSSSGLAAHFQALELPSSASLEDVKKAYRRLALKHHPDKNQGSVQEQAAQEFRKVSTAYQVLSKHLG